MGDGAEITRIARGQAQKVDRVFTEAVERLRIQVIRADHILTGALEVVEDTGVEIPLDAVGADQAGFGRDEGHQGWPGFAAQYARRAASGVGRSMRLDAGRRTFYLRFLKLALAKISAPNVILARVSPALT